MSDGSKYIYLPSNDPNAGGSTSDYTILLSEPVYTSLKKYEVALVQLTGNVIAAPINNIIWVYTNIISPSLIGTQGKFQVLARFLVSGVGNFDFNQINTIPQWFRLNRENPQFIEIQLTDDLGNPLFMTGTTFALLAIRPSLVEF